MVFLHPTMFSRLHQCAVITFQNQINACVVLCRVSVLDQSSCRVSLRCRIQFFFCLVCRTLFPAFSHSAMSLHTSPCKLLRTSAVVSPSSVFWQPSSPFSFTSECWIMHSNSYFSSRSKFIPTLPAVYRCSANCAKEPPCRLNFSCIARSMTYHLVNIST